MKSKAINLRFMESAPAKICRNGQVTADEGSLWLHSEDCISYDARQEHGSYASTCLHKESFKVKRVRLMFKR